MFVRTPQPGLWFIAGSFAQCRIYSKYLGLQIKAAEEGLLAVGACALTRLDTAVSFGARSIEEDCDGGRVRVSGPGQPGGRHGQGARRRISRRRARCSTRSMRRSAKS